MRAGKGTEAPVGEVERNRAQGIAKLLGVTDKILNSISPVDYTHRQERQHAELSPRKFKDERRLRTKRTAIVLQRVTQLLSRNKHPT